MHSGWPLQFITENAPSMGKARSLLPTSLSRQPSTDNVSNGSADEYTSDADAYLEPSETRSEVSQFYDAYSDGFPSSASQSDPAEVPSPLQTGGSSPIPTRANSLHDRQLQNGEETSRQAVATEGMLEWRRQRDAMTQQIFGLKQDNAKLQESNATLQQDNEALAAQTESLQRSNHQLTAQTADAQQQVAELRSGETQATELFVARWASNILSRVAAQHDVRAETEKERGDLERRNAHLKSMLAAQRQAKLDQEEKQRQEDASWPSMARFCLKGVGLVAFGAVGMMALDWAMQDTPGPRLLEQRH